MIGLKRGIVKLTSYKKEWPVEFKKEKKRIEDLLGDKIIAIEHCGSTAVPNLDAKPVIDILVGVKTIKREGEYCNNRLDKLKGYCSRKKYFPKKNRFVVAKGNDKTRTHYIHIVRYKGIIWKKLIMFRDCLRNNKSALDKYSKLKKNLSNSHPDERKIYTQKKSKFIKDILNDKLIK